MNVFLDALHKLYGGAEQAFNTFGDVVGGGLYDFINQRKEPLKVVPPVQAQVPVPQQMPSPTPTQQRYVPTAQDFEQGFQNYGQNMPVATASADFATSAQRMPPNIDPFIAAVLSIMETQGGLKTVGENNVTNLRGNQNGVNQFVDYPDYTTAILGGDNNGVPAKGFTGTVTESPYYEKFRDTGNLADFFQTYTPPGPEFGNPSMEELLSRYNQIRSLFPNFQQ